MERADLRIFFDTPLRHQNIRTVAQHYGLEKEPNPDEHFGLAWSNRKVSIIPRLQNLQPVNEGALQQLAAELLPVTNGPVSTPSKSASVQVLVFSEHKYYKHLQVGLYDAGTSAGGKLKNPLNPLDPQELAWQTNTVAELKFYSGIAAFINNHNKAPEAKDLQALRAIVQNPLGISVYYHNPAVSENIGAASLVPVQLDLLQTGLELHVYLKHHFYEISGQLSIGDKTYPLNNLPIKYGYFILAEKKLHLADSMDLLRVMGYFKKHKQSRGMAGV
jgi:hypothetical protein